MSAAGLSWLLICAGAVTVNALITNQSLPESAVLLIPAMIVEFLICISTWYICRSFSLSKSNFIIILLKHIVSMVLLLAVWLLIINIYSIALDQIFDLITWQEKFSTSLPLLCAIGFFLYFLSCLFYYLIISIENVQRTEQQILEQKLLTSQAELKSLKAMIQPHFLFNSLTALSKLAVSDSNRAREVCLMLSDFFRYSLRYSQKEKTTIEEELRHVENYLNLEKIRLGDRLNIKLDIDDNLLHEQIISLILLPLAENAVKHGIQQCIEGGTIFISILKINDHICIEVSNPYEIPDQSSKGEGFGLMSLKQRMLAYYGDNADLSIVKDKNLFKVALKMPITG